MTTAMRLLLFGKIQCEVQLWTPYTGNESADLHAKPVNHLSLEHAETIINKARLYRRRLHHFSFLLSSLMVAAATERKLRNSQAHMRNFLC